MIHTTLVLKCKRPGCGGDVVFSIPSAHEPLTESRPCGACGTPHLLDVRLLTEGDR